MVSEHNTKSKNESKVTKNAKLMLVRYGRMGFLGWFEHHEHNIPKTCKHVIIKSERGLELGELVGLVTIGEEIFATIPIRYRPISTRAAVNMRSQRVVNLSALLPMKISANRNTWNSRQ